MKLGRLSILYLAAVTAEEQLIEMMMQRVEIAAQVLAMKKQRQMPGKRWGLLSAHKAAPNFSIEQGGMPAVRVPRQRNGAFFRG
ncbi:MAG: hypothetical protein ABF868_09730 [Sporolactobacillus sp.]